MSRPVTLSTGQWTDLMRDARYTILDPQCYPASFVIPAKAGRHSDSPERESRGVNNSRNAGSKLKQG